MLIFQSLSAADDELRAPLGGGEEEGGGGRRKGVAHCPLLIEFQTNSWSGEIHNDNWREIDGKENGKLMASNFHWRQLTEGRRRGAGSNWSVHTSRTKLAIKRALTGVSISSRNWGIRSAQLKRNMSFLSFFSHLKFACSLRHCRWSSFFLFNYSCAFFPFLLFMGSCGRGEGVV